LQSNKIPRRPKCNALFECQTYIIAIFLPLALTNFTEIEDDIECKMGLCQMKIIDEIQISFSNSR
jgi:hypothetical protein